MQQFTNETIDIGQLPKFEEVQFQPLHRDYWKIMLIANFILLLVLLGVTGLFLFFSEEFRGKWPFFLATVFGFFSVCVALARISFKKRGFAFRQHDVLYKSGIISDVTIIIPYSRIQHVALNEGVISRIFGLASVGIFTAGGGSSDVEIPGIEKDKAQSIKQLLMSKLTEENTNFSQENE